ncbi:hypothetical protein PR202_ga30453 [Eleusine coracana subsp. coracana]|uniref:Pentatricopeptide repeat-containing protein n=1 Tax=Eleusine coracana subsp. coracana TaxID=191504 RepID=A0AAV5DP17_ELECO|nr:hypothetical protein PR202_ga30453 [Eleusine coracana subsp. coracana]
MPLGSPHLASMEHELLRILRSIKAPRPLLQTHAQLVAAGLAASPRLLTALVSAALSVLSSPRHGAAALRAAGADASTVAHNTLIERLAGRGSGRGCSPEDALAAYAAMRGAGVPPNGFTFTFLLRACESLRRLPTCWCVHAQIVRCGFAGDVVVQNALINVYYKCSDMGDVAAARQVFDEIPDRDVVSWNSIIGVYMLEMLRGQWNCLRGCRKGMSFHGTLLLLGSRGWGT